MSDNSKLIARGAKLFDLPLDALAGLPKVEICGTEEAVIENHKGILEYGENLLTINLGKHVLYINGSNLNITAMNEQGLRVHGKIESIRYDSL